MASPLLHDRRVEGRNPLWYVLHVRPRFEKLVRVELGRKGYESLVPTYVCTRTWSDRVKPLALPLFPGHVFCRFDLADSRSILVTAGVNAIAGAGRKLLAVADAEIHTVRKVSDSGVPLLPWCYLSEGKKIQVVSGPLTGLHGIYLETRGRGRLIVSLSLLMRSISAEVDAECVRPLTEAVEADLVSTHTL
jgi:transcription antitermination factor NusG